MPDVCGANMQTLSQEDILQMHLREMHQREQISQSQLREVQLREENSQRQLREMEQREEALQRQLKAMQKCEQNLQRQLGEIQQREENSKRQFMEMQQREENSQKEAREMQQREENSQRQLKVMQERDENSQRRFREMQQREKNSERKINEMQQRNDNSRRQLREMQQCEENTQRQLREIQQREENSQIQVREMQQREENLQRQLWEMQKRDENLQAKVSEMQRKMKEKQRELRICQEGLSTAQKQLRGKEEEFNEIELTLSAAQLTMLSELRHQESFDWVIARSEIQMTDRRLGNGGLASVFEGTYCGCTVAVKHIHDLIISPHNIRLFEREMNIASKCRHPHLLQFIGATVDEGSPLFVTELMEKSLRTLLEQRQLSETEIRTISLDVARALNFLHQKKPEPIIHRDVSSANVLLWKQGDQWRGKVSDYGTANFMQQTMTVALGANIYTAPEALTPDQTAKVSFHCILNLLIRGGSIGVAINKDKRK